MRADRSRACWWLTVASASLATTSIAHAFIGCADQRVGASSDNFGAYAHVGIVPLAFVAAALVNVLIAGGILGAASRAQRRAGIDALLTRCAAVSPVRSIATLAASGGLGLVALEFGEQLAGLGHIGGLTMALGGALPLGIAAVVSAAAIVVIPGLAAARAFIGAAAATIVAVLAQIAIAELGRGAKPAPIARRECRLRNRLREPFGARRHGLRAPPSPA